MTCSTNQNSIQAQIWRGYAKAAQKLGLSYAHYRPLTAIDPISTPNQLDPLHASFSPDGTYTRPSPHGKPLWHCLADGSLLQPGDYLVGGSTYFIAAMPPLLPILAVACNAVVSISRVQAPDSFGVQDYSGMTAENQIPFAEAVPCSILQGTKGAQAEAGLPADTRLPWWTILIPAFVGDIRYGDMITDGRDLRYVVSSAELTDHGYRLSAGLVTV